jgi:hypothetical protein
MSRPLPQAKPLSASQGGTAGAALLQGLRVGIAALLIGSRCSAQFYGPMEKSFGALSVGFPISGRTIISSTWRKIRAAIARITPAVSASNPGSYKSVSRRSRRCDPDSIREPSG